jgi:hypothetical protein
MRESRAAENAWEQVSIANTMVSRCRSTIGKRPANTTCDTFRSIPTDENGAIAKVEQSTSNLTLCGPCTSGVTRSSRMRSRCDLSENRAFLPARANVTAWLTGSRRASRFSQKRPLHSAGHSIFRDRFKLTRVSEDPESRYYPSQVRDFFRGPVQSREGDGEN